MKLTQDLVKIAESLRIQPTEMRVYAALLELGRAQAAAIAKRSKIQRSTVYSALERLIALGLVSQEKRSGVQKFLPAPSDTLVTMAEERLVDAQQGVKMAKEVAKIMRSKEGVKAMVQPKVQIFEGATSIKRLLYEQDDIWRQSMMDKDGFWVGFQDDSFLQHYGAWVLDYWKTYKNAADARNEKLLLFSNSSLTADKIKHALSDIVGDRRNLRALPHGIQFSTTIWVLGDYIVTLKTRANPHIAIVFRDPDLADNLATIFKFLWQLTLK